METINNYLPELMAFYQVAKAEGFTEAANRMNLSKAQLSKQVKRLETVLSVELFFRTTRNVKLTNEGKVLLNYAESIVEKSIQAADAMKEISNEDHGSIKVTVPSSFGDWCMPPIIEIANKKFPHLKVSIDLNNIKRDLINEDIDFAIRAMDETNPDLIARYIGHLQDAIVATPKFLKENKHLPLKNPHDLEQYPCLLNSLATDWNNWKLMKGQKDVVIKVTGPYSSSSYQTAKILCMNNLGVARVPLYLVAEEIKNKKLIQLFPEYKIATHPIYLVYPAKSYRTKTQKIFRDLLLSWFDENKEMFLK